MTMQIEPECHVIVSSQNCLAKLKKQLSSLHCDLQSFSSPSMDYNSILVCLNHLLIRQSDQQKYSTRAYMGRTFGQRGRFCSRSSVSFVDRPSRAKLLLPPAPRLHPRAGGTSDSSALEVAELRVQRPSCWPPHRSPLSAYLDPPNAPPALYSPALLPALHKFFSG